MKEKADGKTLIVLQTMCFLLIFLKSRFHTGKILNLLPKKKSQFSTVSRVASMGKMVVTLLVTQV